jgi:hypothetical protein
MLKKLQDEMDESIIKRKRKRKRKRKERERERENERGYEERE